MKHVPAIAIAMAAGASLCAAQSPHVSLRVAPAAKVTGTTTTASSGGGFMASQDNCASAHTNLGTGSQFGLPFDTSVNTTGTTGQNNNPGCLFFSTTGIQNDAWGDWTASGTGTATVSTCGSTIDTKVAVYPLSTCPADNTQLGCNDDACGGNGLQSSVSWAVTAGTTYTIQLGTFPNATQGAGVFDIMETGPAPCGQKDDGSTENALGWTNGGDMGWMTVWTTGPGTCLETWDSVEAAYGTLMFPGSVTNGSNSQVVVYHDSTSGDNNPTPANLTVDVKLTTAVVNGDTDILNKIPLGTSISKATTSDSWTLVSAEHVAGQFPAPLDQTPPIHAAGTWFVGSTLLGGFGGVLDTTNLANNDVPPTNLQTGAGVAANYLLRVDNTGGGPPGTAVCFGDGSGAPCGCLNESDPGTGGCRNSVSGTQGSLGSASGTAGQNQTSNPLTFTFTNVRTQPGLFFCANNTIGGGAGSTFGDGLRCCGGGLVRVENINPPVGPEPVSVTTTVTLTPAPPGTKRCYQYWYRDPGGPCGQNFNLSSAVTVTWGP